jgi:hypothetical protein
MANELPVAQQVTCPRHPKVETYLRCGRCDTPICPKCLVHTPVGARCPDCARPPKRIKGLVRPANYAAGIGAGLGVAAICGVALGMLPVPGLSWLFILVTGFAVGEAVSAASNRQRTTGLAMIAFASVLVGTLVGQWLPLLARMAAVPGALQPQLLIVLLLQVGPMEIVLLLIAGVIASTRVTR